MVAQLVEQRTENPRVGSSILSQATIFIDSERDVCYALCFWDTFKDTFNFNASQCVGNFQIITKPILIAFSKLVQSIFEAILTTPCGSTDKETRF